MANYGLAVSQKGYDVKNCPDNKLVFSSSFQTLKIYNVYSVSTTKPSSGSNTITINHNLGYYAPYIIIYNGSTSRGQSESFYFCRGLNYGVPLYSVITNRQYTTKLEIDVESDFDDDKTNSGDTVYFTVYQFIDDFSTISENSISTSGSSSSSGNNYGLRISKAGYDVKTCDDKDLIISSSTPTYIVHKKGIVTGGSITHNLGYIPDFLSYIKYSGYSYITYTTLEPYATTSKVETGIGSGDTGYYIIFKNKLK